MRLDGVVHLTEPQLVATDALGQTFVGQAGLSRFELAYPRPSEQGALDPPYPVEEFVSDTVRHTGGWGYSSNFGQLPDGRQGPAVAWMVEYLGIKVTGEADGKITFAEFAHRFGKQFDSWYARALEWTELWSDMVTSQAESWHVRTRGHVRDMEQPPSQGLTGWGLRGKAVVVVPSEYALNRRMLASAFTEASTGDAIPTEWELYLRGRRTADARIAVIEAATATEVALTRALGVRSPDIPSRARENIAKQAGGLVELLTLLESIDSGSGDSLIGRVRHRLAGPRNDAVHRGVDPGDARAAGEAARAVLDRYSPLTTP